MLAASRQVEATVISTDSIDEVVAMMEQLRMEEEPLAELMAGLSLEPSHVERKELNGALSLTPRPAVQPPRPAEPPAGRGWRLDFCSVVSASL